MAEQFNYSLTQVLSHILNSLEQTRAEHDILFEVTFDDFLTDEIASEVNDLGEKFEKLIKSATERTSLGVVSIEIRADEKSNGTFLGHFIIKDTASVPSTDEFVISSVAGVGNVSGFDFELSLNGDVLACDTWNEISKVEEEEIQEKEPLPEIPEISWEYATLKLGQDELALTAAKDFYRGIPALIENLNQFYEEIHTEDGLNNYKVRVHGAKGVLNTFGALELGALCRFLEFSCKAGNYSRIDAMHPILIEELTRVIDEWGAFREKAVEKSICEDMSWLSEKLDSLNEALVAFDLNVADELVEELGEYGYRPDLQTLIEEIINAVADIDDAKAIQIIEEVRRII